MTWKAILSSSIGSSHEESGKPCQDWGDLKVIQEKKIIIGAVSDGAGSALYSDEGSQYVVQTIIQYLEELSEDIEAGNSDKLESLLRNSIKHTRDKLEELAQSKKLPFHEFACTILVFLATPNLLIAMQIGDGFIIIRRDHRTEYQMLFSPDKGEYANSTSFITSSGYLNDLQIKIIDDATDVRFIFLSTDGIERLAAVWQDEKWSPYTNFLSPLEDHLFRENDLYIAQDKLTNFLGSDKINSRTNDDKTVLICVRVNSTDEDSDWLSDINNLSKKRAHHYQEQQRERTSSRSKIDEPHKKIDIVRVEKDTSYELKPQLIIDNATQDPGYMLNVSMIRAHSPQQTVRKIDRNTQEEILGNLDKIVKFMQLREENQTVLEIILNIESSQKRHVKYYIDSISENLVKNIYKILYGKDIDELKFRFSDKSCITLTLDEVKNRIHTSSNLRLRQLTFAALIILILLICLMLTVQMTVLTVKVLFQILPILTALLLLVSGLFILARHWESR